MTAPSRIRHEITKRSMTQAEAAKRIGISPQHLSDVLRGQRTISPHLALRMEYVFGLHAAKLLYLQALAQLEALQRPQGQEDSKNE